jgi:hypothetical protein
VDGVGDVYLVAGDTSRDEEAVQFLSCRALEGFPGREFFAGRRFADKD